MKAVLSLIVILSAFTNSYSQNCAVNAGVPQSVCENETLTLFGGFVGVSGGAFYWQQISGPSVIIDDPSAQITTVTGITGPSTLGFRFYANCGDGSIVYDEVIHTILPITIADAGPDQSSCPGPDVITMGANVPQATENQVWSFSGGNMGITVDNIADPNATLSFSETNYGTAVMIWTISTPNCSSSDTVLITNCGGESPVDANRGGNNTITLSSCYTTTQSYRASASYPGFSECGQQGVWNIISGPSFPSVNNYNDRRATFSNLIEGTYVFEWCVSGSCVAGCDLLTIIVPAPVGDVTNATASGGIYCEGITDAILTGNPPLYTGETVSWALTGGPACTIVSPNSPTTAVTGLDGSSTYTFQYTIQNAASGCNDSDNATISFTAPPTISLEADKVLPCNISETTVNYVATGTGPVSWQILDGPAGNPNYPTYPTGWFNAGSSPVTISDLTVGGSYTIIFRKIEAVGTGCANVYDDIIITSSTSPSLANAGSDQLLACNVDTTFLVGNDPSLTGGGYGTWYQVSKPLGGNDAIIEDPANYVTKITNLSNGLYVFRWIITGGGPGCATSQDDVDVAVASTTPTIAAAGPDELSCYDTPYQLQGNSVILNETGTWTVTPSSGITFSDANDPTAWVYGLQMSTAYTFTWTIVNACGVTSDDVVITTTNVEGPVEADAGPDGCYPSGTTVITLAGNDPTPSSGMWYEVSSPGPFTFDDPTNPATNINITLDGDYVLEWVTSYNSCTDSRDTVLFTVSLPPTPANAGSDQTICGNSAILAATPVAIGTGTWTQVYGPPGVAFSDPNSPTATLTGLLDGIYGFEWSVSNGACSGGTDIVELLVSLPPVAADAGPDQFICGSDNTVMAANAITTNLAFWKMVDGPNTPSFDQFDPTTAVSGMIMGIYTFTWNSINPPNCPASIDTIFIEVVPIASVINSQEFCDTISVALNGNPNSNGYWEQVILGAEPVINITTTGNSSAIADSLLPGSGFTDYAFRYVIDYPGCTSADTTYIRVYEQPSLAMAGPDQEFCDASTFTMAGTLPVSGTGSWSILSGPGSGSFVDPSNPTTDFINAAPGVYIFLWTVENGLCNNADPIRVDNWESPTVANASTSPYQDYYCDSLLAMLGNMPAVGVGTWTQKSGPGTANIVSPLQPNTEIRNLTPGTWEFYWTITNGPVCPPSIDSCTIVIATLPTVPDAGPDQDLCDVSPVQTFMTGNLITTGLGTWTQYSGPGFASIASPNSGTTLIENLFPGTWEFIWTAATDSCSYADTVVVIVHENPSPADAGADSVICISDLVELWATPPAVGSGIWSMVSGPSAAQFIDENSPTTQVYSLTNGSYLFEWRTMNQPCAESADTVQINISLLPSLALAGANQQNCEQDSVRLDGNQPTIGMGYWTQVGGPPATIQDPTLRNTDVLDLQYGTSTFRWTITNGACEEFDDVDISRDQLPTMADAGADQSLCSDETSTFFDGNFPLAGSGVWTQVSGAPANIVMPTSATSEVNGLGVGSYEFLWTITATGVCPPSRDTVRIDVENCAPQIDGANGFPAVNGVISGLATCTDQDLVICIDATDPEGDPIDITNVTILTGSGSTWSDPVPGDTCFTYEPAPGFSGNESLEVVVCDTGIPADCDTVIIELTVSPATLANAGDDAEICEADDYTVSDATATNYSGLGWITSGDGTFNDTSLLYPTYTPGTADISSGSVSLTLTAFGTLGCPDATDAMVLTITPPSTAFAGADAEICETQTYLVADATAASYDTAYWTTSGTGTFNDINLINPTYFPSANDINDGFVILTLHTANGVCAEVSDNMTLTITEQATAYAGADADVCETDFSYALLDALATEYDSLMWTSSGNGSFDDPRILNPTYAMGAIDILNGGVDLILTAYGAGSCIDATDTIKLNIGSQPIAAAGPDDEICETDGSYALINASSTNATSVLWTTDGTGTFDNPAIDNPVYTPSISDIQDGQVILTITAYGDGICPDASDDMVLTIWPEAIVYAGKDDTICEGSTFQPLDSDVQNYTGLGWTTAGDGSFSDTSLLHPVYTPGPNDILSGSVVLSLTAFAEGTCPDVTDDLTLYISTTPTAFAGADAEICETGAYLLADATASGYTSLIWTSSGTGSFNDPTALNPLYTPSQNDIDDGFVVLTLTAFGDGYCPDVSDDMVLTISAEASVFAGADAEICETDVSYTIADATADDYASLLWTTSGDGSFDDTGILNPTYTPGVNDIAAGSVILTLTATSAGSCPDAVDDMTLTITTPPSAFAGADAEICETGIYQILDATASDYSSIEWTTSGSGTFNDPTVIDPIYTPSQNDIDDGFVVLTLTAYGNGSCADVSDDMVLTISALAEVFAGADAEICETDVSYTIADATADDYASLLWTTSGDGSFDDTGILNPTYTPGVNDIAAGSVTLTLTATSAGSCADATDDMVLTITTAPSAYAGADAEICETGIYQILDATASDYSSIEWTTSGSGTFNDPTVIDPVYTPSQNDIDDGFVVLTLTAYGNGSCADVSDDMVLTISGQAEVFAGDDAEICETDASYTIADATADNYVSLLWTTSGDGSFDDTGILNPTYTPGVNDIAAGTVTLTLTATSAGSCAAATDDMVLTITSAPSAYAGADAEICETGIYQILDATASDYSTIEWTTSGSGTFNDPTVIDPIYTPSQNDIDDGFVVLTLTAYGNGSCADVSDDMTLTITAQAYAYAGADASICETEGSYFLEDAVAEAYSSILWTTTGDGSFDDDAIQNPIYSIGPGDIAAGFVELILTAFPNGSCVLVRDTMVLSISAQPTAFAGPDDEICETQTTYTLSSAAVTNATSILWTTDGTGTFDDPSLQNPTYTPSASDIQDGQVRLSVTAFGDGVCPDASDEMLLTIWHLAQVYAGVDATICEGDDYYLWDATADYYTALLWTTSGDGSFDNDAVLNPIYTPGPNDIAAASVVLTLTATSEGVCPVVSDDMTLNINLAPVVFAGADAEICEYDTYLIADATASNYSALLWTSDGDGSFDDATLLNPVYTPGPGDIILGYAELTITAFGNDPCGDTSDTMVLTLTTAPTVYAGPDDEICETDGMYMLAEATASDYAGLLWTTSGDGTFDDDAILNPTYFPGTADVANGLVTLTITAYGNGSCLDEVDDMELTITLAPDAFAGPDAEICETDTFNLLDATASNYASLLWTTSGDGAFSDPYTLNPTYYPGPGDIIYGSAFLTLTAYANGSCADSTDSMLLTITPAPYAYAGVDAQICETETYVLIDAAAEDYATLLWTTSGDGTFSDPTILHPEYYPGITDIINGGADLALTAYGLGSCADASDTMRLDVSPLPDADAGPDGDMCSNTGLYSILNASAINYTSLLWTTDGTGSFSSNTVINPVYFPSESDIENGQVVLTLTAFGDGICPDDEDFMVLSIWKAPEVYAGTDAETCEDSEYWILDAWAENYETILWSTSGDGTFNDPTLLSPVYTPGANDITNGTVSLILTAEGMGVCLPVRDTLVLTVTPIPIVDAGPDEEICETDVFTLTGANASNYASLMWTTAGDGTFDDPSQINPVYTPGTGDINTGTAVLTITAIGNGSCGNASDQMVLTISGAALADAGGDGETCEGNSFFLENAYAENYEQIIWTTSGDGTFDDINIMNPLYTPGADDIANGSLSLTMTAVGIGACEDATDSMNLTVTEAATAFAGGSADICETDSYTLENATATGYSMIVWSTSGDGQFDDQNILNPTYTPGPIDISGGGVILTITAEANGSCEDVTDAMSLQIHSFPTADAGDAGVICYGEAFQITDADAENYSSLLWTTSGDGTFSDPTVLEPIYYAGSDGLVTLYLTAYGYGSCGYAIDSLTVIVNAAPIVDAGEDQFIEEGAATQLHGTVSGGSGDYNWYWTPGDFILNANAQNPTTFPIFENTYFYLTVTDNLTGCVGRDSVLVEVEGPGPDSRPIAVDDYDTTFVNVPLVVPMMDNDYIPPGQVVKPYLLTPPKNGIVVLNSDDTFTYTPYDGYVGDDSLSYYICNDNAIPLCDTAMIYIHISSLEDIEDNITIYNGFTPNSDGLNDKWIIDGIENYPDNEVLIFNRWGDIIREFTGYDNVNVFWNGTNEGNKVLPDGTYYYVLKIAYDGQEKILKGWIYLHGVSN